MSQEERTPSVIPPMVKPSVTVEPIGPSTAVVETPAAKVVKAARAMFAGKDTTPKHVQSGPMAAPPAPPKTAEPKRLYMMTCPSCNADEFTDCSPDCKRAETYAHPRPKHNPHYSPTPVTHVYKKPDPSKVILGQPVPDTGFPKIEQAELLKDPAIDTLLRMFTYMRPEGSATQDEYTKKFIVQPAEAAGHVVTFDQADNRYVRINYPDGTEPDILFSSHTDTVHRAPGSQTVTVGDGRAWTDVGSCLGADDTTGNWIMMEMIKAHVPGLYIFHRGEEIGGVGSRWIKTHKKTMLGKMKAAIAFDRKAYHSIITHQGGERCCSEAFSASLSAILGGSFKSDTGGTFTDTKNYVDDIGECTNVSVGYHAQHGPTEWQELSFALGLRNAVIAADWSKLEFERKPGEREKRSYTRWTGGASQGSFGFGYEVLDDYEWIENKWYHHEDLTFIGGKWHLKEGARAVDPFADMTDREWDRAAPSDPKLEPKPEGKRARKRRLRATSGQSGSNAGPPVNGVARSAANDTSLKHMADTYGGHMFTQHQQQLYMMLHYARLWPDTIAHFLVSKGITDEEISEWFKETDIPGKMKWDAD